MFVHPPLWAIQPVLRPSQLGLRPSQPGLRLSQPGLRPSQPGLRPNQPGLRPSQPVLRPSQPCLKPESWLAGWLAGPKIWLAGPQAWLAGPQAWLAGPLAWLAGPQAWLDGPEGGPSVPENGQNMPQIIRYSFVHRSSQQCTVFPWKNHPIVKQGLKRKLRTIGDPRGSLGGPSLPEKSKKMLQIIKYSFVHLSSEEKLSIPIVKSSHSRIFYLDFSWHTSWSIEKCWGLLGGLRGPFSA